MKSNLSPRVNAIMVLGASIGLMALLLPWLLFKPNRLVLGSARSVWQLEPFWAVMLLGCWCCRLFACPHEACSSPSLWRWWRSRAAF